MLTDFKQRQAALNCNHSYIVQAPAGSGKTGVLTQRILGLLALVERPEEVVAITFTKKAAGEMRQRVLESIVNAKESECPENDYEAQTWHLCQAVMSRDKTMGWNLLQHPNRLKVQTIDGFCSSLVKQMPYESNMGSMPAIEEDSTTVYEAAAKQLINSLGDGLPYDEALSSLLKHLDNNYRMAVNLISQMLSKRDHWLESVVVAQGHESDLRPLLEETLASVVNNEITQIKQLIPEEKRKQLMKLSLYAAQNLHLDGVDSPILSALALEGTEADIESYVNSPQAWGVFSELLLVKGNASYRKSVTASIGFPAPTKSKNASEKALRKKRKDELLQLIGELNEDTPEFAERLFEVKKLPSGGYSDKQWALLVDLLRLMPMAAAHLSVLWQESGCVDFTEISMAALRALGGAEEPTDLALKYDNRISHILVDEFQDTSSLQIQLLEKLTAGWQRGDGRTLFLVGDPMQGIYSFRKADIGLFLGVWHNMSLGQVELETLKLETNFRSDNKVISWVNNVFSHAFPAEDNARLGAVSYSHSVAAKSGADNAGVTLKLYQEAFLDKALEGEKIHDLAFPDRESVYVAETIFALKTKDSTVVEEANKTFAVLVRSKANAKSVINELTRLQIPCRAVDIDTLQESAVIQQLLGITRALLRPSDRIGWYSVLRGPWAGLSLSTLEKLHSINEYAPLWNNLVCATSSPMKQSLLASLHNEEILRLTRVVSLFSYYYDRRKQFGLREAVETLWHNLGGPLFLVSGETLATESSQEELQEKAQLQGQQKAQLQTQLQEDADKYFGLLENFEYSGDLENIQLLEQKAMTLFSSPGSTDPGAVQIMSMHKSKGLEFDYVFLPYGAKRGRGDDRPLLIVDNYLSPSTGHQSLFLAALPERSKDVKGDAVYEFLWQTHTAKLSNELSRLTYVACTRAKHHLYLTGTLGSDKKGELKAPSSSTLLGSLWTGIKKNDQLTNVTVVDAEEQQRSSSKTVKVFSDSVVSQLSERQNELFFSDQTCITSTSRPIALVEKADEVDLTHLDSRFHATVGTFAHRLYKQFADKGRISISEDQLGKLSPLWRASLSRMDILPTDMENALSIIKRSILHLLVNEDKANWLFQQGSASYSEYGLSRVSGHSEGEHFIIDRTFIDDLGVRWIIDYKFSEPSATQVDGEGSNGEGHSNQLSEVEIAAFVQQQVTLYRSQLENYFDLLNGFDPMKTCLMLYFPLINRHFCWSLNTDCVDPF